MTCYVMAMNGAGKKRNAASRAVKELRETLGKTQQAFANEIRAAVTTVARWETSNPPPRGDTLLKLARIAYRRNLTRLATDFTLLYFEEILPQLLIKKVRRPWCPGYVICRIDSRDEISDAVDFLRNSAHDFEELAKELASQEPD